MAGVKRGIIGGTFDPIHIGHLILAEEARVHVGLDRVTFVPAGNPWRKAHRHVTPAPHRLAMVRLAIAGNPAFEVSEIEVRQERPSYTADTLARLAESGDDLFFVVGADALVDMREWVRPEEIAQHASVVVARRFDHDEGSIREAAARIPGLGERMQIVPMPYIEVSGSALRKRARAGLPLRYFVPETVAAYIDEHALYPPGSGDESGEVTQAAHLPS
jgi:nicotinate-nucleotide adenylyltransferase